MQTTINKGCFIVHSDGKEIPMYFGLYAMRMMAADMSEQGLSDFVSRLQQGSLNIDDIQVLVRYSIIHGINKSQSGIIPLNEGEVWDLIEQGGLSFDESHWVTKFIKFCVDSIGVKFNPAVQSDGEEKKSDSM